MLQGVSQPKFSKMNTFMKSTIRIDLPRKIIGLLFLFSGVSVSGGRPTDRMPSASTQAIVSEARLNLAEARKTKSDPGLPSATT
jgi:hypothetical protein